MVRNPGQHPVVAWLALRSIERQHELRSISSPSPADADAEEMSIFDVVQKAWGAKAKTGARPEPERRPSAYENLGEVPISDA
jgi:hypothetical protein